MLPSYFNAKPAVLAVFFLYNKPMSNSVILPKWAPRLKPYLIRLLYESDAAGYLHDELLDKVGWVLYMRCDSFIKACEARQGQAPCPVCGEFVFHGLKPKEILHCPTCGWECTWRAYYDTIKNQQLDGGPEVVALFQYYIDAFPKAVEAVQKMLLIDGLIHGFHHFLTSGRTRRPVGINLISGYLNFVVDFLDHLSYDPSSTPGTRQNLELWREKINSSASSKGKKKSNKFLDVLRGLR
jgi:hypothetical protein